jgi:hypothetical protein
MYMPSNAGNISMVLLVDLLTILNMQFLDRFVFYLRTAYHMPVVQKGSLSD